MLYTDRALLETGKITEAEELINSNCVVMITTIREGERFATDLYRLLLEKKGLSQTDIPLKWNFGFSCFQRNVLFIFVLDIVLEKARIFV